MTRLALVLLTLSVAIGCRSLDSEKTGGLPMTSNTALLVLDLQKDFCHPSGKLHGLVKGELDRQNLVEANLTLIRSAAEQNHAAFVCPILFDYSRAPARAPEGIVAPIVTHRAFGRGEFGGELIDDLDAYSGSFTRLEKPSLSAFSGTDLHERLRGAGVTQVVISGLLTNLCVESTARDAFDLGYQVRVVRDATATFDPHQQKYAVENIFPLLGKTITVAEFQSGVAN